MLLVKELDSTLKRVPGKGNQVTGAVSRARAPCEKDSSIIEGVLHDEALEEAPRALPRSTTATLLGNVLTKSTGTLNFDFPATCGTTSSHEKMDETL